MLPPIPQGLVPVTVQQDPAKPRSDIQPVTPAQESEANSQVRLEHKQRQDEQGRRKRGQSEEDEDEELELLEDPHQPSKKAMSRKGLLVNLKV
ncbi:MAG: aspartate-semialdehyde dehydrogenase [Thiopseudomonas sp.]|nr:aspartate-semialdehyde dehydrogenase [Thiopseudomonas sp.]